MRDKLPRIMKTVEFYLLKNKQCRADDDYLYMCIVRDICNKTGRPFATLTFKEAMEHGAEYGFPNRETIRRCRQKAQELNPDLRPKKPVIQKRKELEMEYRLWVQKGLKKYVEE